MAKISIRRPRIISKKFPEVDSTIDGVEKSLNELVFSYEQHVDKTLQKKHIMMAISSMVLLLVLGSFISPKGKAESSVFYPESCLGGWVNPQYAQGEQETTSNGDESQFTKHNSAVLPKNTNAEMYCGNFKGKIEAGTRPTKIIVSLALTKGPDLLLEDTIESGSFASSSRDILDTASTTDVSFTLIRATSSSDEATSSTPVINTATTTEGSVPPVTSQGIDVASATASTVVGTVSSVVSDVVQAVQESIINLFESNKQVTPNTDTVVVPAPAPVPVPTPTPAPVQEAPTPVPPSSPTPPQIEVQPPTSFLPVMRDTLAELLFQKVFAQESADVAVPASDTPAPVSDVSKSDAVAPVTTTQEVSPTIDTYLGDTHESPTNSTSNEGVHDAPVAAHEQTIDTYLDSSTSSSQVTTGSTTESTVVSSPQETQATTTGDTESQNNFLEVLYTFDGVTWKSLGELNEISMKYRTFEIPVTATTSWLAINNLQIKIVSKNIIAETPTTYLDAVRIDVLYETAMTHEHPDFARDVIVNDQTEEGLRIATIINSDTALPEVWYTTVEEQGVYGVPPGTWVQVRLDQISDNHRLIAVYGQNIFWIDDDQKMLWLTNIQKESNDGIGLLMPTSTEVLVVPQTPPMSTSTDVVASSTVQDTASSTPHVPIITVASTSMTFVKQNGEEWIFEYNSVTKTSSVRKK